MFGWKPPEVCIEQYLHQSPQHAIDDSWQVMQYMLRVGAAQQMLGQAL
jgi:hypothetical protein